MSDVEIPDAVSHALTIEAGHLQEVCTRRALAHRSACNGWNTANYIHGGTAALAGAGAGASAFSSDKALTATLALIGGALAALATF